MSNKENIIDYLEQHIPELAEAAVVQAYWQTLASGHSVVVRDGDGIYEEFPDGTRKLLKMAEPSHYVPLGLKLVIP